MEIRDVDEKGEVIEKEPQKQIGDSKSLSVPADDPLFIAGEQVLGVETSSEKARYEDKIRTIVEWAKLQTDDQTPGGIKRAIRDIQMKIGSPVGGESRIDYLYSFIALSTQKKEIDKRLGKYYRE